MRMKIFRILIEYTQIKLRSIKGHISDLQFKPRKRVGSINPVLKTISPGYPSFLDQRVPRIRHLPLGKGFLNFLIRIKWLRWRTRVSRNMSVTGPASSVFSPVLIVRFLCLTVHYVGTSVREPSYDDIMMGNKYAVNSVPIIFDIFMYTAYIYIWWLRKRGKNKSYGDPILYDILLSEKTTTCRTKSKPNFG